MLKFPIFNAIEIIPIFPLESALTDQSQAMDSIIRNIAMLEF